MGNRQDIADSWQDRHKIPADISLQEERGEGRGVRTLKKKNGISAKSSRPPNVYTILRGHSVHDVRHTGGRPLCTQPAIYLADESKKRNRKRVREIRSQRDTMRVSHRLLDSLALLHPGRHQEHREKGNQNSKQEKSIPSASRGGRQAATISSQANPHTGRKKQQTL